ncbi:hypothetical protein [Flagellimonas sp.]|uniref:hypothetical protein n=1 Tax=Flagellimonas sp. TaxID=2058762 RepID=UPI003BAEBB75
MEEKAAIDNNLTTTIGKVIRSNPVSNQHSKRRYQYEFYVNGKKHAGSSIGHLSDWIENGNFYQVEYSSENPESSRMIFEIEFVQEIKTQENGIKVDTLYVPKDLKIKKELNSAVEKLRYKTN